MNDNELKREIASALAMDEAGKEIAAILLERIHAAKTDDEVSSVGTQLAGTLIFAARQLLLTIDGPNAKGSIATLLRNSADTLEAASV